MKGLTYRFILIFTLVIACRFLEAQSFSPPNLPNLTLWLRADSGLVTNGNKVTAWNDVSGSGNGATAPAAADSQPTVVNVPLLNNLPALAFNGSTNELYGKQIQNINTSSLTVFIVNEGDAQTEGGTLYAAGLFTIGSLDQGLWLYRGTYYQDFRFINNYDSTSTVLDVPPPNGMPNSGYPFAIWEMRKTYNTVDDLYKNGVLESFSYDGGITSYFYNAPYLIGNTHLISGFDNLEGKIAEIIIYTGALSDSNRNQVENYIYHKYAPSVSLGPNIAQTYSLCSDTLNVGNGYSSYIWSTGSTDSLIVVNSSGTYWVQTTDVFGRVSSDTIQVNMPAISLNQAQNVIFCAGQTVNIATVLAADTAHYTFLWSSGQHSASIAVTTPGNYSVKVTDSTGCSQRSDTTTLHVNNFASSVSLGGDTTFCTGSLLSLASPDTGWGGLIFQWSSGSSDSITAINTAGTVTVTVTNGNGCSASVNKTVSLTSSHAATLNFSGDTLCFGQNFVPQNLSAPTDSINSYHWTFGDGGTGTGANPAHDYTSAGLYNVILSALTYSGCSTIINKIVRVDALPVASFQSIAGCVNNSYQFTDFSSVSPGESIANWNWNFGDGNTSDSVNPFHIYNTAGNYHVSLTVTNNYGCSGSTAHNISVAGASAFTPVSLTVPGNGAVLQNGTLVFGWNSRPGAVTYSLEIGTDALFSAPVIYNNITINQDSISGFTSNTSYYWRIFAYNSCGDSTISVTDSFSIFSPSDWSCLTLWLRGDSGAVANGGNVSEWKDGSGNGYNANSSTGEPALINEPLLNNLPSLKFNGTTSAMTGPLIAQLSSSSLTTFIVNEGDAVSSDPTTSLAAGLFTIGNSIESGMWIYRRMVESDYTFINSYESNSDVLQVTNSMPNKGYPYAIFGMEKNLGLEASLYINGVLEADTDDPDISGSFAPGPYTIGETPFNYLTGGIAEIIIYECNLSDADRQKVENYIYNKYAPPVYLGPDIVQTYKLCPVTLNTGGRFVSYIWSTGDTSAQISVNQSGAYWVSVVDVFGRSSSDTINVTMAYLGSLPAGDSTICYGDSVIISQNLNHPGSYHYLWNTGAVTSQITVSTQGYYSTRISDTSGCSINTDTLFIKVDSFSLLQLLPADTAICAGGGVALNTGGDSIATYLWSPGGAATATPPINTSGIYQVTVTDTHGCVATGSSNVHTHAAAPTAGFSASGECLNAVTSFTNQSTAVSPDAIDSVFWNFGGGIPDTSSNYNASTIYNAFGNYTVILSIKTDSGCTASKTLSIPVYPTPDAGFSYSGSNTSANSAGILCAGTEALFNDTSIAVGGLPLVSRLWKFNGINGGDTLPSVLYSFPTEGNYSVTLIEENSKGCMNSIVQQIRVFAPLIANLSFENVCLGDSTYFTDITHSFSIVAWSWTFGDGYTATIQDPTHYYTSPSYYTVSLTIENAIGCTSSITKNVNIVQPPIAGFISPPACEFTDYAPVDTSQTFGDPIAQWQWNIGGNIYNTQAPGQLVADTNSLNVQLLITTQDGCTDSTGQTALVEQSPTALFTYTPQYGSAPIEISFTNLSTKANSYEWNFGDGTFSTDTSPQHTYTFDDTFNVVLYAQSAFGCADSLSQSLLIIPTYLDISVDAVYTYQTPQPDGSTLVGVVAVVSNQGTRLITSAAFVATLGSGNSIWQSWTGNLSSGQVMVDSFPTQFILSSATANTFVCVEAEDVNDGQTETNYNNNRACASLTGTMQLSGPYPSPAVSQSLLGIILPAAGQVVIDIFDELGKHIVPEVQSNLPVGRTDYYLPVQQLAAGEYYLRITYANDTEIRKFVVK